MLPFLRLSPWTLPLLGYVMWDYALMLARVEVLIVFLLLVARNFMIDGGYAFARRRSDVQRG